MFNPSFPGTCPYITSVGATMIPANSTVYEPETACEEVIYSGGGFSNYFAMPDYQKTAVDYYLTNYYPDYPATIWNSTGMVSMLLFRFKLESLMSKCSLVLSLTSPLTEQTISLLYVGYSHLPG